MQARQVPRGATKEDDSTPPMSVHWSANAGSFPHGNEGQEVIWQAPDYVCRTTISATSGVADPSESSAVTSSLAATASVTLDTLTLVDIRMVIVNPVQTAYPYVGDQFHTRVLLCICGEYEWGMYCGRWWPTPSWVFQNGKADGALAEPSGSPGTNTPPPFNDYVWGDVYPWPTSWAQPTIRWQIGFAEGSDSDANYNRDYWFVLLGSPWYTPVGGDQWGEDFRTYSVMGEHRLRAYVVWGAATGWSSTDWEHATRIFVRNHSIYTSPSPPPANDAQLRLYCEWLSSYYEEPYEWGGEWVGGKETPGTTRAGGPETYDGYGIDCSGLVCNAAYRAAYNWTPWRTNTTGLAGTYYTTGTTTPNAGNILVRPGVHVISIVAMSGDSINVVHAKGGESGDPEPKNRVAYETGRSLQYYLDRGYSCRRLLQH